MVLRHPGQPLEPAELPDPEPGPRQVRIRVLACGVCRTDLHIVDGDLADPALPLVLGHQIVGVVDRPGEGTDQPAAGDMVGVPWLAWACGACPACARDEENLCELARFTGYDTPGGFSELAVADARFCVPISPGSEPAEVAPLLCAGSIGYRCLRAAGDPQRLGMYGFGQAARILSQVARHQGRQVFAFTRPGDTQTQNLARGLGATWAGSSAEPTPEPLDAAIVFAAAGELIPRALAAVRPGGTVVCGEIHMSDIPSFPYELLWGERVLRSVANVTRRDAVEMLALATRIPIRTNARTTNLSQANGALDAVRSGGIDGPLVLEP
jgi:propanol-preferring alcohol dehydrogenase